MIKKNLKIIRIGDKISVSKVLERIEEPPSEHIFNSQLVKTFSVRLQVFLYKGIICTSCGVVGVYFCTEKYRESNNCHLNLYAVDNCGEEVLMTKDHILPKSKGGSNKLENLQTMCYVCNQKKGNNYG